MTSKQRFPLSLAQIASETLVRLLEGSCERIQVAGSVRRGRSDVGDIEILAIPKSGDSHDLFGQNVPGPSMLDERCRELIQSGHFELRPNKHGSTTFGPMNKLLVQTNTRIPVDVFTADARNWGMALMVRTGPAEWNVRMMSRFQELGMEGHAYGGVTQDGMAMDCPDEETVFNLLSWDYREPHERK